MKLRKMVLPAIVGLGLMLLLVQIPASVSAQEQTATPELPETTMQQIDAVRGATAQFRDLKTAEAAGYGKFLTCFHYGDNRGMGQHYVNGTLAGDDVLDPMKPEALVYEPRTDGSMILVAFEYLVFASKWDPQNTGRPAPTIYGQPLMLMTNIPKTPPVWGLHLWLYSYNPEGLFASFNPLVSCPASPDNIDMSGM